MWHGNTIYFISDRDGVMNLFTTTSAQSKTKKLTDYQGIRHQVAEPWA